MKTVSEVIDEFEGKGLGWKSQFEIMVVHAERLEAALKDSRYQEAGAKEMDRGYNLSIQSQEMEISELKLWFGRLLKASESVIKEYKTPLSCPEMESIGRLMEVVDEAKKLG